jgi:hypothetical protein
MKTDKETKSNQPGKGFGQSETPSDPVKKPSWQFAISITVGVLTILLLATSYYYGIIRF